VYGAAGKSNDKSSNCAIYNAEIVLGQGHL
jgi:hypothetical protein